MHLSLLDSLLFSYVSIENILTTTLVLIVYFYPFYPSAESSTPLQATEYDFLSWLQKCAPPRNPPPVGRRARAARPSTVCRVGRRSPGSRFPPARL
jgi:hypothetical protein